MTNSPTIPTDVPSGVPTSRVAVLLLIVLLWAVAYLPQLGARSLRLEEGRRATPAREMLQSNDWIVPRLYGEVYLNKPPAYFWLVAATGAVTGKVDEFAVRFPAALGVLLCALTIYLGAPRGFNVHARAIAALFTLACLVMFAKGPLGEIETFFVFLLIATALTLWHAMHAQRLASRLALWLLAGIFMGAANLTKGPVGLVQVYLLLLPWLIFTRSWRQFFSVGHLFYLLLSFVPVVLWVMAIHHRTGMTYAEMANLWSGQMGINTVGHVARQPKGLAQFLEHYWRLPLELLITSLPAVIWAIAAFIPAERRAKSLPRDLWLLFGAGAVALLLPFWLWPTAESRHIIFFFFPLVMLAGLYISLAVGDKTPEKQQRLARGTSLVAAAIGALASIAAIVLDIALLGRLSIGPSLVYIVGLLVAVTMFLAFRRTPLSLAPVAAGMAIPLAMLIAHGGFVSIFNPLQAPRDRIDIARRQLEALVPANLETYTTRGFGTFASPGVRKGDTYYNLQFYLPENVRAIRSLDDLPKGRIVTLAFAPDELRAVQAKYPYARILGEVNVPKGPPRLILADIDRTVY